MCDQFEGDRTFREVESQQDIMNNIRTFLGEFRHEWVVLLLLLLSYGLDQLDILLHCTASVGSFVAHNTCTIAWYILNCIALHCSYGRPPFTLQRICELLRTPTKHYSQLERVLISIEKVCVCDNIGIGLFPINGGIVTLISASLSVVPERHNHDSSSRVPEY